MAGRAISSSSRTSSGAEPYSVWTIAFIIAAPAGVGVGSIE